MLNFLHYGLSFPKDGTEEPLLESSDQIDGFDLSWTLGVIFLFASSLIPKSTIENHASTFGFIFIVVLSVLAVGVVIRLKRGFRPKVMDLSQFHPVPQHDGESRLGKYHSF